ncbi:MAG: ABC transporter ATP-binding protein/permease [Oscillospiraceae bacterium]|nr:ABC transporter ATP-binding protein/permease [Oscillospiraceae bacterium]
MKHFDALPELVADELCKRGVNTEKLLYCVKADLDGEGKYFDVYVTFDDKELYIISGYEEYKQATSKEELAERMRGVPGIKKFFKASPIREMVSYRVEDFKEYEIAKIKNIYVDRHQNTARLVLGMLREGEVEDFSAPPHGDHNHGERPMPPSGGHHMGPPPGGPGGGPGGPGGPPPEGGFGGPSFGWSPSEYEHDRENILIARFSIGYCEKFERFCERLNMTHRHEEIDDTLLDQKNTVCPICHQPYPNPNRPVCPRCVDKRSIFMKLMGLFKDFKVEITFIMLSILLSNVMAIITPWFSSKMLYDDVLSETGRFYGQVLLIVLLMLFTNILSKLTGLFSGIVTAKVVPHVTHTLRSKIYASMNNLSLQFFTSKQTGSLMSRVDRDSNNVYSFFVDIVPYGIANIVKIVGIGAIMMMLSPILTVGLILLLFVLLFADNYLYKKQRKLYRKLDVAMRSLNSVLSDVMNGQRVVKSFAKEQKERDRYRKKNQDAYEVNERINNKITNTNPFVWGCYNLFSIGLFCLGCFLIVMQVEVGGTVFTYGVLTGLISYTGMLYEPIDFFMWIGDRWARCVDAASRMFEILESKPTVVEDPNPVRLEHLDGDIEFRNVFFEYEAGHRILKNVSFKVTAGHMFGIVGKTGAGKSTIINLMARLYDVTSGEILINGVPIKKIATEDLRRCIGIVSQETYIFVGSVADNIRYARPNATMEEVIEAAKSANAHEFITKLPDGYNTKIGSGGVTLSGGEKQRISIARAIIQDPDILILDEATASMDTRTERKIQVAIDSLKEGRTIISIAHRLSTLRDADMLCVIENGEVKEMGTHDKLIREKGKYFELYKLQADALKFIED